nr:hypothetical protein [uncultured Bacteroides sp.]
MKQFQYIAALILASLLTPGFSGCSNQQDEIMNKDNDEKGIAIESITTLMESMASNENAAATRAAATKNGFSVNTNNDPTFLSIADRTGWKMDFTLYYTMNNTDTKYDDGSFTGATHSNGEWGWNNAQKYFPNYTKPKAEALIYPNGWTSTSTIAQDQSNTLLAQDVLIKAKGTIDVAHEITIQVNHKHSMLDFVIKDVNKAEINEVKVSLDGGTTFSYTPYKVTADATGTGDMEYMLILPENTKTNPVVQITTQSSATGINNTITYKQTIGIIKSGNALGSNNCYCFTLQGEKLSISPVTILNWATGESLPGEYIAVTAYPTFKGRAQDVDKTYYFYYDNCLTEKDSDGNSKPKLQAITFNKNSECTIKPDGRILTHIGTENDYNKLTALGEKEVTLGAMVIDLADVLNQVAPNHK